MRNSLNSFNINPTGCLLRSTTPTTHPCQCFCLFFGLCHCQFQFIFLPHSGLICPDTTTRLFIPPTFSCGSLPPLAICALCSHAAECLFSPCYEVMLSSSAIYQGKLCYYCSLVRSNFRHLTVASCITHHLFRVPHSTHQSSHATIR